MRLYSGEIALHAIFNILMFFLRGGILSLWGEGKNSRFGVWQFFWNWTFSKCPFLKWGPQYRFLKFIFLC